MFGLLQLLKYTGVTNQINVIDHAGKLKELQFPRCEFQLPVYLNLLHRRQNQTNSYIWFV